MGKPAVRFVAKAVPGVGWRVWDRKLRRWWGNYYKGHPARLLAELNGEAAPDRIVELSKGSFVRPRQQ